MDNLRNQGCTITAPPMTASVFRTSPALAHGDDSNYLHTVNVTASAGDTSTASLPSERPLPVGTGLSSTAAAIDRPASTFRGIRSLKHKNDRSFVRNEGGFDAYLRKTSSLQDVTDLSVSAASGAADRIRSSAVSGCLTDDESSSVCRRRLHGSLSSFDACLIDSSPSSCMNSGVSIVTYGAVAEPSVSVHSLAVQPRERRRTRDRQRRAYTNLELEQVGCTGIVASTAQFWEELSSHNSTSESERSSLTIGPLHGARVRHSSVDSRRRSRRDPTFRYSTICAPCDAHMVFSSPVQPREVYMNETDERKVRQEL